jgi:hypothetical protein
MASGEMASQFFAGGAAGVAVLLATVLTLAQASCIYPSWPSVNQTIASSLLTAAVHCVLRMAAALSGCSTGS